MSQSVTTISTPYPSSKGGGGGGSTNTQVKSRPSLRRPKVAIVEAVEAEAKAAKGLVISTCSSSSTSATKVSSHQVAASSTTSLAQREEAEGAENEPASTAAAAATEKIPHQSKTTSGASSVPASSEDYSKLRCSSVTTEELAEREKAKSARRQNRCPDYPGLAFGAAMGFGSDTMMKFNIIKNELHNIMRSQLKRVDGEVVALSERIKLFDENLEKSEAYIKVATTTLAEAVQLEMERKEREGEDSQDDSALSQFDAQMALLEGKLLQAKVLAEESAASAAAAFSSDHSLNLSPEELSAQNTSLAPSTGSDVNMATISPSSPAPNRQFTKSSDMTSSEEITAGE